MQTGKRLINTNSRTISRSTPIPSRASAHPEAIVKGQPRYPRTYQASVDDGISRHPTTPPPVMWQYETAEYVAESSLASLSLVKQCQTLCPPSIDALDTQPSVASIQCRERPSPADISSHDLADINTVPPSMVQPRTQQGMEIADIPTVPPGASCQQRPDHLTWSLPRWSYQTDEELFRQAQTQAADNNRRLLRFNPFDRLRWWLLYPGRLESLLWSSGAVLLVGLTVFLLLHMCKH